MPEQILQSATTRRGSLSLWGNNVSRETRVGAFRVVHIYGTNGHQIITGIPESTIAQAELMIFYKRYTGTPTLVAGTIGPNHRAFVDKDGNIKLTGPGSDFDAKYMGTNSGAPVPNFNGEGNLAASFAALDDEYKWANRAALDAVPTASIAPAKAGIRLAVASDGSIQIVPPATLEELLKRKSDSIAFMRSSGLQRS